jgi:hypothetical protein
MTLLFAFLNWVCWGVIWLELCRLGVDDVFLEQQDSFLPEVITKQIVKSKCLGLEHGNCRQSGVTYLKRQRKCQLLR